MILLATHYNQYNKVWPLFKGSYAIKVQWLTSKQGINATMAICKSKG